ncbi:MAG: acetate--CoA ligase family protein [Candidatus ainarchaeum sp.]|nr:acetate--CoA ligase family protein [Candidatus ainarchaeum sp.]
MGMLEDFESLKRNRFRLLPYGWAKTKMEAHLIARSMGYPVALKIISEGISHKTDVGGVKVGIRNDQGLALAYDEIMESVKEREIQGMLVQKMARKGIELIIGGKKDAQFGHVIVLGLGGVYVEVFRDISARLCPINENDVEEMIDELKSHPILKGTRGQKGINVEGLKELMLATCRFMHREDIKELDLNPVIFDEKGYDIVDARIGR